MKILFSSAAELRFRTALQRQTGILAVKQPGWSGAANIRDCWMDMTWITGRLALGGGIWNPANMGEVARTGITHIIDMQIEFDDTPLAEPHGIQVLWNPVDDDFQPKPPEVFQRGVEFALQALDDEEAKLYIHCAAGVHRAPMMALAVLRSLGYELNGALDLLEARRNVVDMADVYVRSV